MEYRDEIHGTVQLPEHIKKIIQTKQFQRLKKIRQFGLSYKNVREANYSRYDHSIGTYILASKFLGCLERNTKGLQIPKFYSFTVTLAALLHDIGHGPFSHTWELICPDYKHEYNARSCVVEIFRSCCADWDGDHKYAIDLIDAFILGDPACLKDRNYQFLFDVVNNKQCNVDVDKWDYLKRDYFYIKDFLISPVNVNFEQLFTEARVSEDRTNIEYRYCDLKQIYNMFHARSIFHIEFYRHPAVVCLEAILKYTIHESKNKLELLEGHNILDIRSDLMSSFLKFFDDEIMRILKNITSPNFIVDLIKCLDNGSITEIFPTTDEEKSALPEYLIAKLKIPHAGEEMNVDKIMLYGDQAERPQFEKRTGFHESIYYFKIEDI